MILPEDNGINWITVINKSEPGFERKVKSLGDSVHDCVSASLDLTEKKQGDKETTGHISKRRV